MGRYLLAAAVAVVLFDQDFLAVAELGVQLFGHWRGEHGHSTSILIRCLDWLVSGCLRASYCINAAIVKIINYKTFPF